MILAAIDGMRLIREAGLLAYPLGLCSLVAVFIICERAFALRNATIIPDDLAQASLEGKPISGGQHSALGRIIGFIERHPGDTDGAKADARLEIMKMERGVNYLDVIYTAAPLIGTRAAAAQRLSAELAEELPVVRRDLRRIALTYGAMLALLAIIWFAATSTGLISA